MKYAITSDTVLSSHYQQLLKNYQEFVDKEIYSEKCREKFWQVMDDVLEQLGEKSGVQNPEF